MYDSNQGQVFVHSGLDSNTQSLVSGPEEENNVMLLFDQQWALTQDT